MNLKNITFAALILICICDVADAQFRTLRGQVLDEKTREPIVRVNLLIKGGNVGTTTDSLGIFILRYDSVPAELIIEISHVGYDPIELSESEIRTKKVILLTPRVLGLTGIEVEAKRFRPEIAKDLPQSVTIIEMEKFEIRGYQDVGDLLKTDQSIQVSDNLSGRKQISLRAGNADDAVVVYDGVRINNSFNNIADLSLIDLQGVQRIEIIKGSNTVLYGSDAFSGVINIVPGSNSDDILSFQQRMGSYNSGDWSVRVNPKTGNIKATIHAKKGATNRFFEGERNSKEFLINEISSIGMNLYVSSLTDAGDLGENRLKGIFLDSEHSYKNERDNQTLLNKENILSLNYAGNLAALRDVEFGFSSRNLSESSTASGINLYNRDVEDNLLQIKAEKLFHFNRVEQRFAYQYEDADLEYLLDEEANPNFTSTLTGLRIGRRRHGIMSITKFHNDGGSSGLNKTDLDISFRQDNLENYRVEPLQSGLVGSRTSAALEELTNEKWSHFTSKLSFHMYGGNEERTFNTYMNFGTNVKFPVMQQQINSLFTPKSAEESNFEAETSFNEEFAFEMSTAVDNSTSLDRVRLSSNLFRNSYTNKIRITYPIGIPFAFYDNVPFARITGIETQVSADFYEGILLVSGGVSKYYISDKSAFPFKSDMKFVLNFTIDKRGFSMNLHLFKEGRQTGWIRQENGLLDEVLLPEYSNLDLHLSKSVTLIGINLFVNFSGRNLINDEVIVNGLALRDRRFYLTMGFKY